MKDLRQALAEYFAPLKEKILKTQASAALTYTVSGLVILFILAFIILVSYYRDPLGDDVLSQIMNGGQLYLDGHKGVCGDQIKDLPALFQTVKWGYFNWGGRILGFTLFPLTSIFGRIFTSTATGLLFLYTVLLAGALVFNNPKEQFRHPLVIILLFLFMYYLNTSIGFLLMWTFTSIYVVSLALLGTYYYYFQKDLPFYDRPLSGRRIIALNILGFFAGFNHELFSLTILALIAFLTLKEIIKNKLPIRKMFYHTGLALGTLLCVTAPGNFARLGNSHDAIYMTASFMTRLFRAYKESISSALGVQHSSFVIFLLLGLVILVRYAGKAASYKDAAMAFLKNNYLDICFLVFLATTWGVFPYTPSYGCGLFVFWFSVMVLKNIYRPIYGASENLVSKFDTSVPGLLLAVAVIGLLSFQSYPWLSSMIKTTVERRAMVQNAVKEKAERVIVPPYEDKVSNRFSFFNFNNYAAGENKEEFYTKYYGVRIECAPKAE